MPVVYVPSCMISLATLCNTACCKHPRYKTALDAVQHDANGNFESYNCYKASVALTTCLNSEFLTNVS